tara:strand:- start:799 stop:1116 length:318 start_codon:yes stop_codon:yes gene_type:complete
MKNTNEIEKQLARKADAYLAKKAEEMYAIHQEIADFVGGGTNFIDYITHFNQYNEAMPEDKSNYVAFAEHGATKKKYKLELEMNYKRRLVAKYTKELITKLDIFD